jgi:hypothetical protein
MEAGRVGISNPHFFNLPYQYVNVNRSTQIE